MVESTRRSTRLLAFAVGIMLVAIMPFLYTTGLHKFLFQKRIAFMITVTKQLNGSVMLDHIAVLTHSFRKTPSKYPIDLHAVIHENISQSMINQLRAFGYHVSIRDLPVKFEEIEVSEQSKMFRERVEDSGCCGLSELLKLYAFRMTQYHRVVAFDTDMLQLQSIDELYERPERFLYTVGSDGFLGGWWVVQPNVTMYEELVAVLKRGHWDSTGWEGSGIGWVYGGATIQGILPYYFAKKVPPEFSAEVDGGMYHNYGEAAWRNYTSNLKLAHFTGICQKPNLCLQFPETSRPMCDFATQAWWKNWNQLQVRFDLKRSEQCLIGVTNYQRLTFVDERSMKPGMYSIEQVFDRD